MRRRSWVIAAAIPVLLVAGEAVYWRIAAERLRTGYQDWLGVQASRGWDIGSGPVSVGGWPRAAVMDIPNLTLRPAHPAAPGELDVVSVGVRLAVDLLNPTMLDLSLTGPVHVRLGDLPEIILSGDETSASVPLDDTAPLPVSLHARGLQLTEATQARHLTIGLLTAQAEIAANTAGEQNRPSASFAVSSEAIALPSGKKWALGSNISSLSLDGKVNGKLPTTSDIRHWAETWRDGGGSLEISHLAMGWGPLGLTSSATLALDDQLQPMGSGNGRIVGYAETLDRLAAGGLLTKSAATAAKAVLTLMAGTSDTDEPSSVDVPLTLQYRTLSMRQVPLVRLPEVDWPAR